ncbi:glycosyltransferase [Salsipaludibacter albus]|uniref:glycosyltransferase n=1 Tax=Salsipaludibacter albus TaxID=2849650 RepID=UPI0023680468|nr:glycosyltransferase [Salsipaludibacter albus]MBY5161108.1 glycosyltransferase [Salsipaludibacter albus]
MTPPIPNRPAAGPDTRLRIGVLSVHTSPLEQPGTGDGGGLNVYVMEVARRLAERGHLVDVLTRRTESDTPDVVQLDEGLRVVHLLAGPPRAVPKQELPSYLCGFSMQALGRTGDYDLLHSHYWLSGWVARRLSRRWQVPYAHTFHTLGVMKNRALAPGDLPEPPLRLVAEQRLADDADRVLALTCGEGRLLHHRLGMSGRRITVVPPGVDVERFAPQPPARPAGPAPEVAALLDEVGQAPLVLFVGRLQPLKGPDVAVRTLAELRRRVPDARLAIVGGASGDHGGTEPADLRALAVHLGVDDAVHLVSARPQEELAALYRRADVVHVPSRTETFGLVALEAQASGTPVVASAVDGLHSVVGAGGTLVEGHEPADHATAIAGFLTDPNRARRAGEAGRQHALASSWSSTVDRLESVYGAMVRPDVAAVVRAS